MADENLEQELLELENRYWQAMQEEDAETAMQLSDDVTVVAGPSGVAAIDRATLGKMMESPSWKLDAFEIKDAHVQRVSDDVAIVAYRVHEDMTVDGERVSLDAAETSTWIRRDGAWLCAQHSESLVGDPFGRDRR